MVFCLRNGGRTSAQNFLLTILGLKAGYFHCLLPAAASLDPHTDIYTPTRAFIRLKNILKRVKACR